MKPHKFVICTDNTGYEVSLERRKLYEVIDDPEADDTGMVRIVDESGEDYMFPKSYFVDVTLPEKVVQQIVDAA